MLEIAINKSSMKIDEYYTIIVNFKKDNININNEGLPNNYRQTIKYKGETPYILYIKFIKEVFEISNVTIELVIQDNKGIDLEKQQLNVDLIVCKKWPKVALENEILNFDKPTIVRYGTEDVYIEKEVNGIINCNNDTFTDPINGIVKSCYCKDIQNIQKCFNILNVIIK